MATIRDTVKLHIYRDRHDGRIQYFTLRMDHCDWLVLVGETEVAVEYDESDLIDPRTAQLNQAEQALEAHRAESALKERQLLDKIEQLRALPHLDGGWSEG